MLGKAPEKLESCSEDSNYKKCVVDEALMTQFILQMKNGIGQFQKIFSSAVWNGRSCQYMIDLCASGDGGMYWGFGSSEDAIEVYSYYKKYYTIYANYGDQYTCSNFLTAANTGCSGSYNEPETWK